MDDGQQLKSELKCGGGVGVESVGGSGGAAPPSVLPFGAPMMAVLFY